MKILFLHGWRSIPGGVKPTYLKDHGHEVINPKLDDDDFEAALRVAQAAYDRHLPNVVVGSSRGGAVAMNLATRETPLVLLCPAWKKWGRVGCVRSKTIVLHSRKDDVIPFIDSEELVRASRLPTETLIEVGSDHRLADLDSLAVMLWACELLASGEPIPWLEEQSPIDVSLATLNEEVIQGDASYVCDACGEVIVIPIDVSAGIKQEYVEDCPVCCRANVIHVEVDEDGAVNIWAEPEQDAH